MLLCLGSMMNAQNIDVFYKLTMKPNVNDKNYVENDLFVLQIREKQSAFYSQNYMKMMSDPASLAKAKIDINKISSNYIIAKEEGKLYHFLRIEEDMVKYEDLNKPVWKLKKEYKTIDSMNCQQATTSFGGRDYVAWFSKDIPLPEGPYKFKNLPGLVVELYSTDGDYHFVLEGLQESKEGLMLPKATLLKDRAQYLKEVKKFADNPSYKMQMADGVNSDQFKYKTYKEGREVSDNQKYKMINQFVWDFMKVHNNPIEKDDIWIR